MKRDEPMLYTLWKIQRGRCFLCDQPMLPPQRRYSSGRPELTATREHVIPKWFAGNCGPAGSAASHAKCNAKRGGAMPSMQDLDKLRAIHGHAVIVNLLAHLTTRRIEIEAFMRRTSEWLEQGENPRICRTCQHEDSDIDFPPCRNCYTGCDNRYRNWEPKQTESGITAMPDPATQGR